MPDPSARPATRKLRQISRPPRLSEELSGDLRRRIARGELKPGDRLPTEKTLGDAFGVSRAVVREAIARLKADGLIESRQGSGAYVALEPKSVNLRFWQSSTPDLNELRDIFELRAVIEVAVAELAARRRDDTDVALIEQHLVRMEQLLDTGADGTSADDDFHIAVANATKNSHMCRLVEFLGHHFSATRKLTWGGAGSDAALPREAQREHRALFAAIRAGDGGLARQAALDHLRGAAGRFGIILPADLDAALPPADVA